MHCSVTREDWIREPLRTVLFPPFFVLCGVCTHITCPEAAHDAQHNIHMMAGPKENNATVRLSSSDRARYPQEICYLDSMTA